MNLEEAYLLVEDIEGAYQLLEIQTIDSWACCDTHKQITLEIPAFLCW
jgi:Ser-tRNA(Ala) deacylase AlaX